MGVLRCTSKYRKLFGLPGRPGEPQGTCGALGEWYANTLNVGSARYLHYMSEEARLSVLIPLRERRTAEQRFVLALYDLLLTLGVDERYASLEVETIQPLNYGPTRNRSVLGSMLDQAYSAKIHLQYDSLSDVMIKLSHTPCSPLDWDFPDRVAPRLIAERWHGQTPVA